MKVGVFEFVVAYRPRGIEIFPRVVAVALACACVRDYRLYEMVPIRIVEEMGGKRSNGIECPLIKDGADRSSGAKNSVGS